MKKLFIVLSLLFFCFSISAQVKQKIVPTDTIFKVDGKILPVNVTVVTENYVSFIYEGKEEIFRIERKDVHKIIYKNGRIDVLNPPAFEMIDEESWKAVWLTEDKKEVAQLYIRGNIDATAPQSARSPKAAKKGAEMRLKKKAAVLKSTVVLVTYREKTGGYGEFPGYIIKGVAYGDKPQEEDNK